MKKTGIIVLSLFMVLLSGCRSTAQETPKNDTPSTVSDYAITVTMVEGTDTYDIDGKYTGEVVNGKPQGVGTFKADEENGSTFTAYAIPCSTSSFDNISGGTTNVIVLAACYIE